MWKHNFCAYDLTRNDEPIKNLTSIEERSVAEATDLSLLHTYSVTYHPERTPICLELLIIAVP